MLFKLIFSSSLWLIIISGLLFISAGTLDWFAAWIYLIEIGITGYMLSAWMYQFDPALLKERLAFPIQKQQKPWDKIFILIVMPAFLIWYPIMGFDAKRYLFSTMPFTLQIIGFVAILASMYITFLTFKENTFAAPTVKVQVERKQKVIDTGVYAVVRHPMYAGLLFFLIGTPFLLGSWLGVIWGFLIALLMAYRSTLEEKVLEEELQGYRAYTQKVKYRFIPYIW